MPTGSINFWSDQLREKTGNLLESNIFLPSIYSPVSSADPGCNAEAVSVDLMTFSPLLILPR